MCIRDSPGGIIADPRRHRALSLRTVPLVLVGSLPAESNASLGWRTGATHDLAIHHHYFLTGQRLPTLRADADCFFTWSVKTLHFLVPPLIRTTSPSTRNSPPTADFRMMSTT